VSDALPGSQYQPKLFLVLNRIIKFTIFDGTFIVAPVVIELVPVIASITRLTCSGSVKVVAIPADFGAGVFGGFGSTGAGVARFDDTAGGAAVASNCITVVARCTHNDQLFEVVAVSTCFCAHTFSSHGSGAREPIGLLSTR
jgi:hypothetical protein